MRRLVLALYALIFVAEVVNWAIVPLLPRFANDFALSKVETGAVLAAASVMTVAVAVPVGIWADRLGPRALTLASGVLLAAATVGQGLAGDFWTLLVARAGFGASFATIWTAGLAWLAHSVPAGRRATALGATVTTAGIGGVVAPVLAGQLAERFGVWVPFTAVGAAAAAVTLVLVTLGSPPRAAVEHQPVRETFRLARRNRIVLGALVITVLGGLTSGVVNLLVPLQLDANGISEGTIGIVFSSAAGVFILASGVAARLGDRAARLRVGGLAALLLACALGLVVASATTPAIVIFILVRAPLLATIFTISFPLAAAGARRAGVGEGAAMGLLNVVWGVATVVGPLAGGALAQAAGESWTYGALIGCCLAAAAWAFVATRADPARPEDAPAPATTAG